MSARLIKNCNADGCHVLHSLLEQAKRFVFTDMPLAKPPLEEGVLIWVKGVAVELMMGHPTHHQDKVIAVEIPEVILIWIMSVGVLKELLRRWILCRVVIMSNLEAS